jgi:hypothetical protein
MRRKDKKKALEYVKQLNDAHEEIKNAFEYKKNNMAIAMLSQCREKAIELKDFIGNFEGEGCITVNLINNYCELVGNIKDELVGKSHKNENKIYKNLRKQLIQIENSINNDITLKKEVVFLPYKASMWDSFESIYLAAKEDENCDAYVIPIPYYDRNPDKSLGQLHYEGNMYPSNIPITRYDTYDFIIRKPDMIFIHNPYDDGNFISSIHPDFYSDKMKKYTDCLVYVPYYASSGGQEEAQALCPAYENVDYIVIQSPQYRKYYDASIPNSKFLALGSPKFDSIIKKCQNPPEKPEQLKDKKVYFYNTSLAGMLNDTEKYLDKMQYVFDTFKNHKEACLLWRPHPLLESAFNTMRPYYKSRYEALKRQFIDEKIGIYDTTPSIEQTIALSDVYIGDNGSSVTSLFGVVGKPVFLLNKKYIKQEGDEWRGIMFPNMDSTDMDNRWIVSIGNKLWHAENNDFKYKYYCDLSQEYISGREYNQAKQIEEKIYIMPNLVQDILVVENKKVRKIKLEEYDVETYPFRFTLYTDKYAFIIPRGYPHIVRFEFATEKVVYIKNMAEFIIRTVNVEVYMGAVCIKDNELYVGSPIDSEILIIDIDTLEITKTMIPITVGIEKNSGISAFIPYGDEIWILPTYGYAIRRWNPKTYETRVYTNPPSEFKCKDLIYPYGNIVFYKDKALISPELGNMYLCLDINTGDMKQWNPPACISQEMYVDKGYYKSLGMGGFPYWADEDGNCLIWTTSNRRLYNINLETEEISEVEIKFDLNDLCQLERGFGKISNGMVYGCIENVFNSLDNLINGKIIGNQYNKEKQIEAYKAINASPNGDCGEKVYRYLVSLL